MSELSLNTKNLIAKYDLWKNHFKPKEGVPVIHVDEVASRVAAFYEQIRTVVDWQEEHLMRRAAIIRKLKRRFLDLEMDNFSSEAIAEPLVLELIRSGYFPNDRIEESKIVDVKKILAKYVFIFKNNPAHKQGRIGLQFYNRILEIAACEIEETLSPSIKEMALIDYMFSTMRERIKINDTIYERNILKPEPARNAFGIADAGGEKNIQIYIAVQQALFKLDNPIISYNLLKYKYAYWNFPSDQELLELSQNIHTIWQSIEKDLSHPLAKKFYVICEKYDTPYLLLGDILSRDNLEKTTEEISDPPMLEDLVKTTYSKRLTDLKAKIRRAAIYSTASIFITKILSLIILEILIAKIILGGNLNLSSLAADILIPTILMAILVASVRPPSRKNLSLVVIETMKIAYQKDKNDSYEIKASRRRSIVARFFLSLVYLSGAVISFSFLFWIFNYFAFPLTSIVINFIFIALILFAGRAVQKRAQELTLEEESEGFLGFVSDILLLPITEIGRILSNTWKQYNAFAAFFNALIDMPFSAFVEFLERWRYFIKERKEDMR